MQGNLKGLAMGTSKNTKPILIRIRNTAVQKETMMDVITMKECETLPMVIHIDRTAQIHKVHGSGIIKQRVHICRKFVRRREKTETINPERNILTVQGHQKINGVGRAGIQNIGQIMTGVARKKLFFTPLN
jgi:hypothetical protein